MRITALAIGLVALLACNEAPTTDREESEPETANTVRLITLDPGHFHAALVQKSMYDNVDSVVHVYAPEGPDLQLHLNRIESFNTRAENPTRWKEEVYTGPDFFEKMLADRKGNVVVLSGNNEQKTEFIMQSLQAGFHVLADKPMVISQEDFGLLEQAFEVAEDKDLLLYDIMTERYEITTMLQRELSMIPAIFGELEKGTPDNPAIVKESVHHFYKYVAGQVLTRPAWFMDVRQQGEGLVDVTTHLVDLVQWACFPEQVINYPDDIEITSARRWPTAMTKEEFKAITKQDDFPAYLRPDVKDSVLQVYSNGEINYQIKDVNAKVSVIWNYRAAEGAGDTHYSIMRGSKANLIIRQGAEQQYRPTLYLEPIGKNDNYAAELSEAFKIVQQKFPGIELKPLETGGWEIIVPDQYHNGHEAHFAQVTERFLQYLQRGDMPRWEVPNMLAKYYTTVTALAGAKAAR